MRVARAAKIIHTHTPSQIYPLWTSAKAGMMATKSKKRVRKYVTPSQRNPLRVKNSMAKTTPRPISAIIQTFGTGPRELKTHIARMIKENKDSKKATQWRIGLRRGSDSNCSRRSSIDILFLDNTCLLFESFASIFDGSILGTAFIFAAISSISSTRVKPLK